MTATTQIKDPPLTPPRRGTGSPAGQRQILSWLWTEWPTLPMPTEASLVNMAQQRGARAVHEWHRAREEAISNEKRDPLQYGWEAPPLAAARQLLAGQYVPGQFGPVAQQGRWVGPGEGAPAPLPAAEDLLLMTGSRFGKSNFGGKLVNETMRDRPGARVRCWSQSLDTSRSIQQAHVFKHLPPGLRKIKRLGQFCKISYTGATGFTDETFLFNTDDEGTYAQCWFLTYHSWQQDKTIAEGPSVSLTWCDEEVPAELMDTLRYRVGDQGRMIMLLTFTPITGYTDAVGQYIAGARIVECVPARRIEYDLWQPRSWRWGEWLLPQDKVLVEGCPPGHVPFILEHAQVPGRYTLCAGSTWNPYIDLDEVLRKAITGTLEVKLIRWFGWPLRKVRPALSFSEAHIVPPQNVPPLAELTIYLAIDPCPPPRNWFMVWLGLDREERVWVLAEWPDLDVGEWAVPGTEPDGKPGPGAFEGGGRGFDGYKLLVWEREGWVEKDGLWQAGPHFVKVRDGDRYLDPRAASWKVPSLANEDAADYLQLLLEPVLRQREGKPVQVAPGLDCQRAEAAHINEGNQLIDGWLTEGWDPQERLTPMNAPRFYINRGETAEERQRPNGERVHPFLRGGCGNTIWSLRTFTGKTRSGATDEKSACKDPIDCLKSIAKAGVGYVAPGALGSYGVSFGY